MITVNGEQVNAEGMNISSYLEKNNYDSRRIVVEVNYEIIKKENYDNYNFKEGDIVEIVSFVGGGWFLNKKEQRL